MFDKLKGMKDQMAMLQKLMTDPNFRAFMMHPKIQALLRDPEFQEAMQKQKDPTTLLSNPKFAALRNDPEIAQLASKLNLKP